MKLMLIGKNELEFTGSDGQEVSGFMYDSLLPDDSVLSFWSEVDHDEIHETVMSFDANLASDLNIRQKVWQGKRKFAEVV